MAEVAFHFNAPDKAAYVCRLLRKAYLKGARVSVLAPVEQLETLDRGLWLIAQGEFVPHCVGADAEATRRHSPIHLLDRLDERAPTQVLVNLTDDVPADYSRFDRVIEVVGQDDGDRALARQRWRRYLADGVEPQRHDLRSVGGE
ncbi:MAG: DNA polymerase III subunit chi [Hydrogenophaga sp.]|uniref:DNA polymerase III subunit chi n=1 Tax=Hydrogenophaga sp. TaxID=1904254 RepID=UPI00168E16F7|nr:DNA polymerase III subunit chi [Hydrogenophaga sp.]NIM43712.1 DNA polymerase III subunit chi [Hydrogenophaga sp.]NIN28781.1 DNA polymerase III subunit chi [Hydrogenophaga sp.]NIN33240.1 DNA polymerase III subunit chi [Hydrogenophaga sp.]NIN57915.1 DNA polymerase III subunit chi [Hydrogenophaga sp.]NIO54210.1 DNA polymerase III subunit chi [Hydrogenophaga sp.]